MPKILKTEEPPRWEDHIRGFPQQTARIDGMRSDQRDLIVRHLSEGASHLPSTHSLTSYTQKALERTSLALRVSPPLPSHQTIEQMHSAPFLALRNLMTTTSQLAGPIERAEQAVVQTVCSWTGPVCEGVAEVTQAVVQAIPESVTRELKTTADSVCRYLNTKGIPQEETEAFGRSILTLSLLLPLTKIGKIPSSFKLSRAHREIEIAQHSFESAHRYLVGTDLFLHPDIMCAYFKEYSARAQLNITPRYPSKPLPLSSETATAVKILVQKYAEKMSTNDLKLFTKEALSFYHTGNIGKQEIRKALIDRMPNAQYFFEMMDELAEQQFLTELRKSI